jgi:hypothetical protein
MHNNEIINEEDSDKLNKDLFIKDEVKKYFTICLLLIIINIMLFNLLFPGKISRSGSIAIIAAYIPFMGFILGYIFNFIPYKDFKYSERYLRMSLITTCAIEILALQTYIAVAFFF